MKRVVFRTDASVHIGTGHVMRCLALAATCAERGIESRFVCRALPGHLIDRIRAEQHDVVTLPLRAEYVAPEASDDYAGWLQVSEAEDADEFTQHIDAQSFVVVDHYGLSKGWEERIRSRCVGLLAVDDLARAHCADFVVDQTAGRSTEKYPGTVALTGSEYALLRTEYNRLREDMPGTHAAGPPRLIVSLGGADIGNATECVIRALAPLAGQYQQIDVVLPETAPHRASVEACVQDVGSPFVLHGFVEHFADLLTHATCAVGAPGTTTWERAAIGLPAVLIPIAANQLGVAAAMAAAGAAVVVPPEQIDTGLQDALTRIEEDYAGFRTRNLLLTDGLGCRRVLNRMLAPTTKGGEPVALRKANTGDIRQVFEWQQEPTTRRFARDPNPPPWSAHQAWMAARLADPGCYFYIATVGGRPAGVVRLGRLAAADYEVSIFVASAMHGQGVGLAMLELLGYLHSDVTIRATVLEGNDASHNLFSRAGYRRITETEYLRSAHTT